MPRRVHVVIDGEPALVDHGSTVAAALWNGAVRATRRSVSGQPRAALCGMGTCFECRVVIDGVPHERACMVACRDGMVIETTMLPPAEIPHPVCATGHPSA